MKKKVLTIIMIFLMIATIFSVITVNAGEETPEESNMGSVLIITAPI